MDKTMSLREAVQRYVTDGSHISIGGFTINRNPMAAVYEIIRQGRKDLHLYAHSNGQGVDELIGGGCVARLEIAYGGSGRFASTCIRFRKAVEAGTLAVEDYSNYQMSLRFLAGAMGVPFLPTRSGLGSDIVAKWGFPPELRRAADRIPDQKLCVMDNPFTGHTNIGKVVLVPAINTDVAILHVQQADCQGTARIQGLPFVDVEQAKAAAHVIITCEELVEPEALRENSDLNRIPPFIVDAVVPVAYGAYPTACYGRYDYDPVFLKRYAELSAKETAYAQYVDSFIRGTPDHAAFLEKAAPGGLASIQADPSTGYARNLDRR
jgi:glutaconate CoA-transferase subunit A